MGLMMNSIHPSAIIGPDVHIGQSNIIGPNCVLLGPLIIGDKNWIGPSVVIGTPPQFRGYEHTRPWDQVNLGNGIKIGSRNVIREFATIHSPTKDLTVVGDDCFLMTQTHVPHDAYIGHRVTMANGTHVAGHCIIQDDVTLGLSSTVRQYTVIGSGAMIGMGSVITRDVPPFALFFGSPAKAKGCNRVGMHRQGFDHSVIDSLDSLLKSKLGQSYADFKSSLPEPLLQSYIDYFEAITAVKSARFG